MLTTEYGIQKSQILSVTVDNGANMIKMIKIMHECVSKGLSQEDGELPGIDTMHGILVDPDNSWKLLIMLRTISLKI